MKQTFEAVSAYPANAWTKQTLRNYFLCFPENAKHPGTAVLWGPWGQPVKFVQRFIDWAGDRNHCVEIHASAETARRTGRDGNQIAKTLGVGAYNRALINHDPVVCEQVRKRIHTIGDKIFPLCKDSTKIVISVGLEDNLSDEAAAVLLSEAKKAMPPGWKLCRNPMTRRPRIGREWIEGHGRDFHSGENIWNFDGVHVGSHNYLEDIGYTNAEKLIKEANKQYNMVVLWSADAQGWKGSGQPYEGRIYVISPAETVGYSNIIRSIQ